MTMLDRAFHVPTDRSLVTDVVRVQAVCEFVQSGDGWLSFDCVGLIGNSRPTLAGSVQLGYHER
ncbi:hypothetical protein C5E41_03605 [Nocardia nova]|nr:hypothetical protein C5E41_03605 [Nocardia nova]